MGNVSEMAAWPWHPPPPPFHGPWHPPHWYAANETLGDTSELEAEMKSYWAAMLGGSNSSGNMSEMAAWPWHPPPPPFHPPWHPPHWYAANETLGDPSELEAEMKAYWAAMLGGSNSSGNVSEMAAWPWHPPPPPFHPPWRPPHWYAGNETLGDTSELEAEMQAYWAAML